jgi:RsiW-degrading membrane proteinase PrsW (M82 family)
MLASSILRIKVAFLGLFVLGLFLQPSQAEAGSIQNNSPLDDQALVNQFAPALYFHPAELFRPQSVDVLIDIARLRQIKPTWLDVNILNEVSLADLLEYKSVDYALDAWLGDEGTSDYKNYTAHQEYYQNVLSPAAGGPPIVTYAHVVRGQEGQRTVIQYWLFYYYNDWFNKHEGDWEMVQVVLNESDKPEWLILSQHHGGTRRKWRNVQIEEGSHPAVFVALGSHANYFCADEIYPNGTTVGAAQVEVLDKTGSSGRVIPDVILIPDREQIQVDPISWAGLEWLSFEGHWGEPAPQGDFGGPLGPADKGNMWEQPYQWGMSQPLDIEVWYKNRLRGAVTGVDAEITLSADDGHTLPAAESLGATALLHADPLPSEEIVADLQINSNAPYDLAVTWPDRTASKITQYQLPDVQPGPAGHAVLTLSADSAPTLVVDGAARSQPLAATNTEPATWDAPEFVWAAGLLPANEVLRGIGIVLLATYVPTLLYVTLLYHSDRYEKEPKKLLAYAFFWGAWPAVAVAVGVRLFFQLPADLLGQEAIEAAQTGLLSPLIEELIKGAAVLFIATRYRREFDDILDGIIYGAVVGFGFAMTANMISYFGSFLLFGFAGLSNIIFVEGILYGLNHGFYTAIFGAGLGYARLTTKKRQRWLVPLVAFGLAVAANAIHSFAMQNVLGANVFTITLTWAGLLAMIILISWSIRLEKNTLETELVGEVPDELYYRMIMRGGRRRAQWRALKEDGLRGLRDVRRIHKLCAELALKKKQARLRPDESPSLHETSQLREDLQAMLAKD